MNHEDDELGPITDEERAEADALRKALESPDDPTAGSDAAFAAAVRASLKGVPPLATDARAAIVKTAMEEGGRRARRRSMRSYFAIAAVALLGLAVPAAMLATRAPELRYGGPTDTVFGAPFEDAQRASDRMDRIAAARTHDYFAALRGEQP